MTAGTNRTLGFIWRNLQVESPQMKTTVYKALVQPLMEYAPTVWDPDTQKEIHQLGKVHREDLPDMCTGTGQAPQRCYRMVFT